MRARACVVRPLAACTRNRTRGIHRPPLIPLPTCHPHARALHADPPPSHHRHSHARHACSPSTPDGPSTEATHTAVFHPLAATLAAPLPRESVQRYRAKRQGVLTHYAAWRGVFCAQAAAAHDGSGGAPAAAALAAAALAEARRHAAASGLAEDGGGDEEAATAAAAGSGARGGAGGGGAAAANQRPATVATAVVPALVDEFVRGVGVELAAVAAVVGGVLGNEVIKALSGRHAPLAPGVFMFDGMGGAGGLLVTLPVA